MFRIVDKFDQSFVCQGIGQLLHPLTTDRAHSGNLGDSQRAVKG